MKRPCTEFFSDEKTTENIAVLLTIENAAVQTYVHSHEDSMFGFPEHVTQSVEKPKKKRNVEPH